MTDDELSECLDDIKRVRIDLKIDEDPDCFRPELALWADADDDVRGIVTVSIGPLMGEQQRYLSLTTDQARLLARHLTEMAAQIDEVVA